MGGLGGGEGGSQRVNECGDHHIPDISKPFFFIYFVPSFGPSDLVKGLGGAMCEI